MDELRKVEDLLHEHDSVKRAYDELNRAGWLLPEVTEDTDIFDKLLNDAAWGVLNALKSFQKLRLSGGSAPFVISAIHKLLLFTPLTYLTGEADEWERNSLDPTFCYNKRYPKVMRLPNGTVHCVERVRFFKYCRDTSAGRFRIYKSTFFTYGSGKPIWFPYNVSADEVKTRPAFMVAYYTKKHALMRKYYNEIGSLLAAKRAVLRMLASAWSFVNTYKYKGVR